MQTDFKVRHREATIVLSRSVEVRLSELPSTIGSSFGQVYAFLGQHGVTSEEPPFLVYHGQPGAEDAPFPIEICAPVTQAMEPPAGWACVTLPAGQFASVLHVGPYDSLGTAYDELSAWIARQGLAIAGAPREVYLSEPGTPAPETRTVVEFPVEASTAALPVAAG